MNGLFGALGLTEEDFVQSRSPQIDPTMVPQENIAPLMFSLPESLMQPRFSVFGGGGSLPTGYAAGGRVGVNVPLSDTQDLSLGLMGNVVNANQFKDRKLTGLDAEYRKEDQTFGVEYRKAAPGGFFGDVTVPGNPNQLWLKYRRGF
jgi:hypothetical protein